MRVRIHQHVNPLAQHFREISAPLDFSKCFADLSLPLHLDIGCARGRFLLKMAQGFPAWNFLGLEIREPLVVEANRLAKEKNLNNLHYEYANATISLDNILRDLPPNILQVATIQFPDPWFKKKHFKRRMVKPKLITDLAAKLAKNGKVFVQSDVPELAAEMFEMFDETKLFRRSTPDDNIFPVKTEREKAVEEKGLPVFRALFERNANFSSPE